MRQASDYLEASNWKDTNEDGILDRTTNELSETFHISILYNTENEIRKQIAIRLGDELRGIGASVSLDGQPYDVYAQKLQSGDFDLFIGGWHFSVIPNYSFMLHSAQVNAANYARYQNGDMDALLGIAYNSVKEEDIKAAYSNLQKKIDKFFLKVMLYCVYPKTQQGGNKKMQYLFNDDSNLYSAVGEEDDITILVGMVIAA